MKSIIFCFLAATAFIITTAEYDDYVEQPENRGSFITDKINETINKLLASLSDPLIMKNIDIDLSNSTVIKGGMNISKVAVTGIHQIVVSKIDFGLPSFDINITILVPDLTIDIKYWADMVLEDLIPLYGEGLLNVNIEEINLLISGAAKISPIQIHNVTVDFTLDKATFNLNGLLNNPEFSALVSTALNDNFVEFCNTYHDVISGYISPIVQAIINQIFKAETDEDWENIFAFNTRHYTLPFNLDLDEDD